MEGSRTFLCVFILVCIAIGIRTDKPCAARQIPDRSVVCVCNDTYCDDITRHVPTEGHYVAYTSSEAGLRFNKTIGKLESSQFSISSHTLVVDPDTKHQTIEGFGGAVTDSAGLNWRNLSDTLQSHIINSYFGENGIEYSIIRIPIGGCDFSTHAYAYNDLPEDDINLSNYTLTEEDYIYKIPMINAIRNVSNTKVKIIATTWSPPVWMKTNHQFYGSSRLKPEYFQTYADYHLKFLEKYAEEGIDIWAITTTNEPINGVVPVVKFNCLGWSPHHMGQWIVNNLGPTIRNSTFKDVKILGLDDQRYAIPIWFTLMVKEHPKALEYIDGLAVHYYGDFIAPAWVLSDVPKNYGKFIIATEASAGGFPWDIDKVAIGYWKRAKTYAQSIIVDLNHEVIGWMDWNLCLNEQGGPNWAKNYVDSPILVNAEKGEFFKQPIFYAMGHFSKFVPRGSRRISVEERKSFWSSSVDNIAFLTPSNTIVVVIHNDGNAKEIAVQLGGVQANLQIEANSITTVEFPYNT